MLFLYDVIPNDPPAPTANLLLDFLLNAEIHRFGRSGGQDQSRMWDDVLYPAVEKRKQELEAAGHKVLVAPAGAAHPAALHGHLATFLEILEQSANDGREPDYLYHTTGTGGVLPAFVAAKLLTHSSVKIRSIAITPYTSENYINEALIVDRVIAIYRSLALEPPGRDEILTELDIDQRFIGPDYAVPSREGTAAIRELAASDAVLLGPVYTGKGFAGLLQHIEEGRVREGQRVVFLHTGDAINLFEDPRIAGELRDR